MTALTEAQSRASTLKAPPAEEANPGPYLAILGGLLTIGCIFALRALKKHKAKNIEYTDNKIAIPFVAPAIIGMIVLVFLPFIVGAGLSFFCYQNGEFVFVGLQNFARLFSTGSTSFLDSMSFYFTFVVTVLWTITNVALHVGIGMALALMLREPWLKLKGLYRVLLIVPWAIPNYITALIWRGMFNAEFGAINNILASFGFDKINWYHEPNDLWGTSNDVPHYTNRTCRSSEIESQIQVSNVTSMSYMFNGDDDVVVFGRINVQKPQHR